MPGSRILYLFLIFIFNLVPSTHALVHSVTNFRNDFSGASSDTFRLDLGWGDSLLTSDSIFTYKSVLTKKLSDGFGENGDAAASPRASANGTFSFKVAYLSWKGAFVHSNTNAPPSKIAPRANIVLRNVELSPDTAIVDAFSTIIAGQENIADTSFAYPSGIPPAPYYLNFSADGNTYSAYWGGLTQLGPIRRTTSIDGAAGSNSSWGKYVTPSSHVFSGGYGTVASCVIPNTGGINTALVYDVPTTFPAGKFEVRWEDFTLGTSVTATPIQRPKHMPDDFGIAADSAGNVLVVWRDTAKLYAVAYNGAHTLILDTTFLVSGIYFENDDHKYRPYELASMTNGKFLLVYTVAGVVYYRKILLPIGPQPFSISSPAVPLTSTPADSAKFPGLAVTKDRVVVSWFELMSGSILPDQYLFKGTIFDKVGNDIDLTTNLFKQQLFALDTISFQGIGSSWNFTHSLKTANVAMDEKGDVIGTYENGFNAKVALIRNTPTYYDSSFFRSKIFTVENTAIPDSVFDPSRDSVSFRSMVGDDTTRIGLQLAISPDNLFAAPGGAFKTLLHSPADSWTTVSKFYKYRVGVYSMLPLKTKTGKLKSLEINYNVKPRVPVVDSVKLGKFPIDSYDPTLGNPLLPRKDSLKMVCSGFDLDNTSLKFRISLGNKVIDSVTGVKIALGKYIATKTFMPPDTVLNPLPLTITSVDDSGWSSNPNTLLFDYRNLVPTQTIKAFRYRGRDSSHVYRPSGLGTDTLSPIALETVVGQIGDTLTFNGTYTDGNDDTLTVAWKKNGTLAISKKIANIDTLTFKFPIDTVAPFIDTVTFTVGDKDTTVSFRLLVRPNRIPTVDTLAHTAYKFKDSTWRTGPFDRIKNFGSDTGLIVPSGLLTVLEAGISDRDLSFGDSLILSWGSWRANSGCLPRGNLACYQKTDSGIGSTFQHTFSTSEHYLTLRASDRSGAFREQKVWLEYPVADSGGNGPTGLAAASHVLSSDLKFIIGGMRQDTSVRAELTSLGSTSLKILSVATKRDDQKWVSLKVTWQKTSPFDLDSLGFSGLTSNNIIPTGKLVLVAPNTKLTFDLTFFTRLLRGDSTLSDTLLIQTNDFTNPLVKIPFQIRYDDLPVMRMGVPGSKPSGSDTDYNSAGLPKLIPTRSTLAFTFSERVKVKNPQQNFRIYSYLDSLKNPKGFHLISGDFSYRLKRSGLGKISAAGDSLADTLVFTPNMKFISDSLKVKAAPGFFIHRDILHFKLSNGITDTSGNSLDLRLNRVPIAAGLFDTVFQAQVDTGFFQVTKTEPAFHEANWNPDNTIRLHFNRRLGIHPPQGSDTVTLLNLKSLKGDSNFSIRVTSIFQADKKYDFQFLALERGDSTLTFKTRPRFPARDTVTISLSGGILDTSGLSLDGNANKFPDWLYSSADSVDRFSLTFSVRDQDFYVFPNPYRFSDSRHLDKGTISFKNLNTLSGFVPGQQVQLYVHSMSGDLIYDSKTMGRVLTSVDLGHIQNSMEWDMKTKSGETVGTGVYIFTIMTGNSKLLHKGKVAVVR